MDLLKRINEITETSPDKLCFIHRDETMTYGELNGYSNDLAEKLKHSNKPLIVYGHMSKWMIVGMIAGLKSGLGYVPIDTSIPMDRVEKIIEKVQPEFILGAAPITFDGIETIQPETLKMSDLKFDGIKEEDVAYTIFTSGSTGMPKGVSILMASLNEFTEWMNRLYVNQEENYWLNQAPLSFDLSVMAVYPSLVTGSAIVMIDKEMIKKPAMIYETLNKYPISAWVSTPSFMEMGLLLPNFDEAHYPNLKHFYFCGEVLKHKTAQSLFNKFSNSAIYNTYGPTEATVAVTGIQLTKEIIEAYNPLPVGYARDNVTLSLTDESELVIAGKAVSIGYVKDEEKTKAQFYTDNNVRHYKTGDKASIQEGLVFINGRIDYQIKLNGYRMELEEIEHTITELDGVAQAVVTPIEKQGKVQFLIASVVLNDNTVDEASIKAALQTKLPEYMIPRKINITDIIPMTPNGKIDRKQLKEVLS